MSYLVGLSRTNAGQAIGDINALYGLPCYSIVVRDGSNGIWLQTYCKAYQSSVTPSLYAIPIRILKSQDLRRAIARESNPLDPTIAARLWGYFDVAVDTLPAEYQS